VALPDFSNAAAAARRQQRRTLRLARARLTQAERTCALRRITRHLATADWLRAGSAIGLYHSFDDEVGTAPIVALAHRRRCIVCFPRIVDYTRRRMVFSPDTDGRWLRNRYGISEPAGGRVVPSHTLKIAFVPLLGFDAAGTRLGYGGGYYDRAFEFRRLWPHRRRPLLVGIAFACQQLPQIERRAHDVALDAVVTEAGIIRFTSPVTSEGTRT
jgi:5-formyltetrahydrofolate cyclo-ligase